MNPKKPIILLPILLPVILSISCSTYNMASEASVGSGPDLGTGYIFGSFYQQKVYNVAMGLVLQNADTGKKIHIRFSKDTFILFGADPVFAVPLPPGKYRVSGIFGTDTGLVHRYRKITPPGSLKHFSGVFEVRKGRAVYIGDYRGYSEQSGFYVKWGLLSMKDNFTGTSDKFRKKYGKWEGFPIVRGFGGK